MAGIAGSGGGTMEYQYTSPNQYGPQSTRCPEGGHLNEHSNGPYSFPEQRLYDHSTGPNAGNTLTSYSLNRSSRFGQPTYSASPSHFPSSSATSLNHSAVPFQVLGPPSPRQSIDPASTHQNGHSRSNFYSSDARGVPAQPHPQSSPSDLGSTPLPLNEPPSRSSSTTSQSGSDSSSSTQSEAPASHSEPTQSQSLGSSRLPVPRVRLPPPNDSRQRLSGARPAEALGTFARYREMGTPEYEALHAAARLIDDADIARQRWFGYMSESRQAQIMRGRFDGKRVASRKAVQSLEPVDAGSLEDTEKTCVICYNDFGVASPEGVVETPLRLPKCKHVFGDKCILQWLQESFHCPYCRDKLESEMARPDQETMRRMMANSEVSFMPSGVRRVVSRVDRSQTSSRWSALPHRPEIRSETSGRPRDREEPTDANSTTRGERRAAPSEDGPDAQRRQRPRFADTYNGPEDIYNPRSFTASTQNSTRERPAQRVPAWEQSSQYMPHMPLHFPPHWAMPANYQLPPLMPFSAQGSYGPDTSQERHRLAALEDLDGTNQVQSSVPPTDSVAFSRQLPRPDDPYVRPSFQSGHFNGSHTGS